MIKRKKEMSASRNLTRLSVAAIVVNVLLICAFVVFAFIIKKDSFENNIENEKALLKNIEGELSKQIEGAVDYAELHSQSFPAKDGFAVFAQDKLVRSGVSEGEQMIADMISGHPKLKSVSLYLPSGDLLYSSITDALSLEKEAFIDKKNINELNNTGEQVLEHYVHSDRFSVMKSIHSQGGGLKAFMVFNYETSILYDADLKEYRENLLGKKLIFRNGVLFFGKTVDLEKDVQKDKLIKKVDAHLSGKAKIGLEEHKSFFEGKSEGYTLLIKDYSTPASFNAALMVRHIPKWRSIFRYVILAALILILAVMLYMLFISVNEEKSEMFKKIKDTHEEDEDPFDDADDIEDEEIQPIELETPTIDETDDEPIAENKEYGDNTVLWNDNVETYKEPKDDELDDAPEDDVEELSAPAAEEENSNAVNIKNSDSIQDAVPAELKQVVPEPSDDAGEDEGAVEDEDMEEMPVIHSRPVSDGEVEKWESAKAESEDDEDVEPEPAEEEGLGEIIEDEQENEYPVDDETAEEEDEHFSSTSAFNLNSINDDFLGVIVGSGKDEEEQEPQEMEPIEKDDEPEEEEEEEEPMQESSAGEEEPQKSTGEFPVIAGIDLNTVDLSDFDDNILNNEIVIHQLDNQDDGEELDEVPHIPEEYYNRETPQDNKDLSKLIDTVTDGEVGKEVLWKRLIAGLLDTNFVKSKFAFMTHKIERLHSVKVERAIFAEYNPQKNAYEAVDGIGVSEESLGSFSIREDEKLFSQILSKKKMFFLKEKPFSAEAISSKFAEKDKKGVKRLLFIPILDDEGNLIRFYVLLKISS